ESMEAPIMPAIMGTSCRADAVGDTPFANCRYMGRKVIEPNMAMPTRKPMALKRAKVLFLKRPSGRTGSAALVSTKPKATIARIAKAKVPRICGDHHSQVLTLREVARTSAVRHVNRRTKPR